MDFCSGISFLLHITSLGNLTSLSVMGCSRWHSSFPRSSVCTLVPQLSRRHVHLGVRLHPSDAAHLPPGMFLMKYPIEYIPVYPVSQASRAHHGVISHDIFFPLLSYARLTPSNFLNTTLYCPTPPFSTTTTLIQATSIFFFFPSLLWCN